MSVKKTPEEAAEMLRISSYQNHDKKGIFMDGYGTAIDVLELLLPQMDSLEDLKQAVEIYQSKKLRNQEHIRNFYKR